MSISKKNAYDSDDEPTPEFYYPRTQNTRVNAVRRLRTERENEFVTDMLGSLRSVIQKQFDKQKPGGGGEEEEESTQTKFNPLELTSQCVKSWRKERKIISSSVTEYMKRQRGSLRHQEIPQLLPRSKSVDSKHGRVKALALVTKYRKEPNATKLNEFIHSMHVRIGEAESELQKFPKKKFVMKEEDILSRPSQLVKLEEINDAGTEKDELRDARKNTLQKLSRKCAYSMVHQNTPLEHRLDVEKELEKAHGIYTADEIFDSLASNAKTLEITSRKGDVTEFSLSNSDEDEEVSRSDLFSLDSVSRV